MEVSNSYFIIMSISVFIVHLILFTDTTLQNADPVRILLDITTQNLTLLNSEERAKCIDMMLGKYIFFYLLGRPILLRCLISYVLLQQQVKVLFLKYPFLKCGND